MCTIARGTTSIVLVRVVVRKYACVSCTYEYTRAPRSIWATRTLHCNRTTRTTTVVLYIAGLAVGIVLVLLVLLVAQDDVGRVAVGIAIGR